MNHRPVRVTHQRRRIVAVSLVGAFSALVAIALFAVPAVASRSSAATVSVFATGLNNPRGLEFGPDGKPARLLRLAVAAMPPGRHVRSPIPYQQRDRGTLGTATRAAKQGLASVESVVCGKHDTGRRPGMAP